MSIDPTPSASAKYLTGKRRARRLADPNGLLGGNVIPDSQYAPGDPTLQQNLLGFGPPSAPGVPGPPGPAGATGPQGPAGTSDMIIGDPVVGGTAGYLLYVDAGGNLGQVEDGSNYASYDVTTNTLTFNGVHLQVSGGTLQFSGGPTINSGGGQFNQLGLADSGGFSFGTSTGGKIGTASNQLIGFWGATPVSQPTSANQAALTNSTSGSYDGTLAAVSGTGDDGTINNNFTDVFTLLNELRVALVSTGLIKGS